MQGLMGSFMYVHVLFVFMLYLIGSFVTVVALEYKLKNVNLKHTLAGFGSVALSAFFAYFVPIHLFGGMPLFYMQIIGIISALVVQALFWWFWFRDRLKQFIPVLAIAFALTVVVSMIGYNIFVWYFRMVIQEAVAGIAKGVAKGAAAVGAIKLFF